MELISKYQTGKPIYSINQLKELLQTGVTPTRSDATQIASSNNRNNIERRVDQDLNSTSSTNTKRDKAISASNRMRARNWRGIKDASSDFHDKSEIDSYESAKNNGTGVYIDDNGSIQYGNQPLSSQILNGIASGFEGVKEGARMSASAMAPYLSPYLYPEVVYDASNNLTSNNKSNNILGGLQMATLLPFLPSVSLKSDPLANKIRESISNLSDEQFDLIYDYYRRKKIIPTNSELSQINENLFSDFSDKMGHFAKQSDKGFPVYYPSTKPTSSINDQLRMFRENKELRKQEEFKQLEQQRLAEEQRLKDSKGVQSTGDKSALFPNGTNIKGYYTTGELLGLTDQPGSYLLFEGSRKPQSKTAMNIWEQLGDNFEWMQNAPVKSNQLLFRTFDETPYQGESILEQAAKQAQKANTASQINLQRENSSQFHKLVEKAVRNRKKFRKQYLKNTFGGIPVEDGYEIAYATDGRLVKINTNTGNVHIFTPEEIEHVKYDAKNYILRLQRGTKPSRLTPTSRGKGGMTTEHIDEIKHKDKNGKVHVTQTEYGQKQRNLRKKKK